MTSPFAKVRVNKEGLDLSNFNFLANCNCCYCYSGLGISSRFLTYRIGATQFYIDWMPGTMSFWNGCPNSYSAQPVLFEEVFEEVPDDIRESLIYNLDVFSN